MRRAATSIALTLALAACNGPEPGPALPSVDLGAALDATRDDPLLLTFAAPRARSRGLVDQAYTLAWDEQGVPAFHTQSAGDFGVVLEVDGVVFAGEDDFATPVTIAHTASDATVLRYDTDDDLSVELWFYVGTSAAATIDVRLVSTAAQERQVAVFPYLRRCGAPFTNDVVDALVAEEAPAATLGAASCGASAADDLGFVVNRLPALPAAASVVALRIDRTLAPQSSAEIRVHRAVADAGALDAAIAEEQALDARTVLREGQARLAAAPQIKGLSRADALLYHSSLALVDRASVADSLSTILLARIDAPAAVAAYRDLIDRIEPDGYLAAAPLFSYGAWEVAKVAQDDAFLADAYAAGEKLHAFWIEQRDLDHDGLGEWSSAAESTRDRNVIWDEVAPPPEVEAVDLNSMLVMEERSLAAMASALGKADESQAWQAAADARAALINAVMWDEATGFYYPVARDGNAFTHTQTDDLKRMEIAGFLPLWAGIVPADRRAALLAKLADPDLFLRAQGVASLSAQDPSFDPTAASCCRWNGPVHVPWQWLVARGLRDAGEHALADDILDRTKGAVITELSRSHQLRELYDADDAARPNASTPGDVRSALIALMMLEKP
jgi:hypothetical protein